ncbi:MAG TPA: type IV toxin-antitoxin system AbiEi family antitoxin domain-containing protein [Anaerolineaceae bacterium]
MPTRTINQASQTFSEHGGILNTRRAMRLGIAPRTLYQMHDAGLLRRISRGIYQLASQDPLGNPDLVNIALRIPGAVICLISALHFYGITTQIPHQVYIALPQSAEKPRLEFPPLNIIWLSKKAYIAGITTQTVDGFPIKVYSIEKTIADCFKFRNKVGNDIALEALKDYLKSPAHDVNQLLTYARLDRVEVLLSRYLEALI